MDPMQLEVLMKEVVYGLLVMGVVTIFNIYTFVEITLWYRRVLGQSTHHGRTYEMLRFILFIMLLVITMLLSLGIWVFALSLFDFVANWIDGLLFAASFFTSVGNFTVNMPVGWRLVPSIIAFSGLFSFAWATASSMAMAHSLNDHLAKNKLL